MVYEQFLANREAISWTAPEGFPSSLTPVEVFQQTAPNGLEVAVATSSGKPSADVLHKAWKTRRAGRASPVLLVVFDPGGRASLCGPTGDQPPIQHDVDCSQAERFARAALDEPSHHAAARFLLSNLPELESPISGLRNIGLMATQELRAGLPKRSDWEASVDRATPLLDKRGRRLVESLGFTIQNLSANTWILTVNGHHRAVAVFCDAEEAFEAPARRFDGASPVSRALAAADRHGLDWVILTRASEIRLYAARTDTGVGRKGRAETFVELNLALLPTDLGGYLPLLFSAEALMPEGTVDEILGESERFAAVLAKRLRERVYYETIPALASAISARFNRQPTSDQLEDAYEQVMLILFRMLFVAYAEDKDLLPYRTNSRYRDHSLQQLVIRLVEDRTHAITDYDQTASSMWDDVQQLWEVVDAGNKRWGVPAYNGGLFSSDPQISVAGASLKNLRLTDHEFAPALAALLVDESPEGYGPVDFRSLSVREFGTIYEGLLESQLAVAQDDLTVRVANGEPSYAPAKGNDPVEIVAGSVYLYNKSGVRKSTGSYFTKPFAVEHLLDKALEPALDQHIARLDRLHVADDHAALEKAFFDFRCADISMGSGHFLVAALDRIEARLSLWLSDHPVPAILNELGRLRNTALDALGELAKGVELETGSLLRRQIARRCVYGVDINRIAVELARLAIWVHTFVPGLPLSFLDHNLVHGDTLTGIGNLDEVLATFDPESDPNAPSLFRSEIEDMLSGAEEALQRLGKMSDATRAELDNARAAYNDAREAVEGARALFNIVAAYRAGTCLLPENPDKDTAVRIAQIDAVARAIEVLNPLHFPTAFPEVFLRDRPGFDCLLGNPPWDEVKVEELGFWMLHFPGLKAMTKAAQSEKIIEYCRRRPDLVEEYESAAEEASRTRGLLSRGPYPGMETGDADLYKAFAWRFWHLIRDDGRIGVVLPRSIFTTLGNTKWRQAVLPSCQSQITFVRNEKEWAFTDVNPGYDICLVSMHRSKGASTGSLTIRGPYSSELQFMSGARKEPAKITTESLSRIDKDLCVPSVGSDDELSLLDKMYRHPNFASEDRSDFFARPHTEFHVTNDGDEYLSGSTWPVYNHLNVAHITFESGANVFAYTDFDAAIAQLASRRARNGKRKGSPFSGMPSEWLSDPSTLPALNPRIVYRAIIHRTNTRKLWFALAPSETILTNAAPYLMFWRGDIHVQAYVLGIMSTTPLDWIGHRKINLNLNFFILNGLPVPKYDPNDAVAQRVVALAAGLTLREDGNYGKWTTLASPIIGTENRHDALNEMDACGALLYGLDENDMNLIFDSYPERSGHADRRNHVIDHFREIRDGV